MVLAGVMLIDKLGVIETEATAVTVQAPVPDTTE